MAFIPAWRNFKRMEDFTAFGAALVYAAAVLEALDRRLGDGLAQAIVLWPLLHLAAALVLPLRWPLLRRLLGRYVWLSFCAGFGQTATSVVVGAALMAGAAFAIFHEVSVAEDVLSLAPVFCAFAAGIGALAAQALLARRLERRPEVLTVIARR